MSRFSFNYELSFNGGVSWTDVTKFVDSRYTRISYPAMSGEYKSSVGQLTFTLSYKRNKGQLPEHSALFASLVNAKINNDEVRFHLLKNNRAIFTGNIDLSNLSQDIRNKPEWVNLSVYDNIRLLDENMQNEFEFPGEVFKYRDKDGNIVVYDETDGKWYYENTRIEYTGTRYPVYDPTKLWPVFKCDPQDCENDLVVQILLSQGWNMSDINFELSEPLFESDGETYSKSFAAYDPGVTTGKLTLRNYLDSLLHEFLAFLTTDGDGKFVIRRFKMTAAKLADTKGTARYLTNTRSLNIGGAPWNKDGIKLTWASPSAMKAKVYDASFSAAITYGKDEEGKETTEIVQGGFDMPGHTYWPETGYMEEVWFDFSSDWLDRQYICKVSPKRDEDLSLMSTKNPVIDAQREPEIVLAELDEGETENPTIKPLRMRTLFYNNSSAAKKFTRYKVYADCLYRAKVNTMACPESASDYDEYTSQFILSEENATDYVRGMYNFRHYGSMVYKWVQKQEVKPQDIWIVAPEGTDIATKVYVTLVDVSFENGETWYSVTAIGVSEYDSEQVSKTSSSVGAAEASQGEKGEKGDSTKWGQGTQLWGNSTARGVAGNQDDYYLNTETFNLYRCIQSGNSTTALWQFVGKIKGNDATFDGTLFTIEYAMSSSPESVVFEGIYGVGGSGAYGAGNGNGVFGFNNNIWSEIVDNWYRGLYIWQRIKTVSPTGEISYSEPTYNETMTDSLLQSCRIDLLTEPKTFVVNPRDITYQYIPVKLLFIGYKGLATLLTDNGIFCKYNPLTQEYEEYTNYLTNLVVNNPTSYTDYVVKLPFTLAENTEVKITTILTEWDTTERSAETVISATKAKTAVVQLATVPTVEDLPTHLNLTDPLQADILTGNNLIYGDYIIVEYFQIAPDEHGNYPEPYDPGKVYYIRTVVDDEVVMQIATISGDFDGTTTYYRYAPNPWMYDSSIWVSEQFVKPYVKVNTVDEVVSLARIKYQTDPSIDYHECLYAYEGYISNLTVGILNVGDIFANNIESTNYQEDADDVPVQGYKLAYQGGENGAGEIRSAGGVYKDMNVRGALRMWKDNKETVGADIEHPALTTVSETMGSDPTGVTINTSPIAWLSDRLLSAVSGVPSNQVNTASGSFGSKTLANYVKATNLNTEVMSGQTVALTAVKTSVYPRINYEKIVSPTITIPSYYSGTISFIVSGIQSYLRQTGGWYNVTNDVYMVKNGESIIIKQGVKNYDSPIANPSYSYEVSLTGGDSVYFYQPKLQATSAVNEMYCKAGTLNFTVGNLVLMDIVPSVGFWLIYSDKSKKLFENGEGLTDRMQMSAPVSFDSNNYLTLRDCSAFINYRTFIDSQGISRTLQNGRTYDITSFNLYVNGGASTGLWLTRNLNSVVLGYRYNSVIYQIVLNSGQYYDITGTIRIAETNTIGVKMMGNYPKYDADDPRGGYDCGNSAYSWNNGYFKTLHYQNVGGGSARELKENITLFTKNALEILKNTEIVNYNYKKDKDKTKKIGFIADDTPEELSGEKHDRMELDHCVAVLIKAVQELSAEIEALKGGTK